MGRNAGAWSALFRTVPFLARSDSWCPGVFPGLCSAVAGSLSMAVKGHIPYLPTPAKKWEWEGGLCLDRWHVRRNQTQSEREVEVGTGKVRKD